jgi:regulator of protease activity HflC (stomatin/prohibitin superfamily)
MRIFIPKDELNLELEVRGTFAISNNEENVNKVFARISPNKLSDRIYYIQMDTVYQTYAQPIIREAVRSIITNYTISEIMNNREAIGQELAQSVIEKLKNTPITSIYFGLADIQPPQVIVRAQESAKEREIAIKEAENEKMVSLKKAEAAYEVAVKQQEVDLKEAETQVLVNKKLTEGVNEAFVTQRALKVLASLAENENTVFFLPMEAMKNPSIMMGMLNRENLGK